MKFGYRKPSVRRSISARTTGRVKRAAKRSINPLYGKKGMGYVNNPQKALYNKIYNKTTIGVNDVFSGSKPGSHQHVYTNTSSYTSQVNVGQASASSPKGKTTTLMLCIFFGYLGIHRFYVGKIGTGILYLCTGGMCFIGWIVDIISILRNGFYDKQHRQLLSD